ncbi:unnamed protein product [Rotaria magnacalcarata]|uniref:Major facilitator superfamily (MFS) profile domain-containing protein n=2 Tax=Rotaria magnacalcarata TaxID=392030 RepID=A0A817AUK9_9BILA|nr:unnamed protein product [Rotaria magnacalcarata]
MENDGKFNNKCVILEPQNVVIILEEDLKNHHARAIQCLIRKLDCRLIPFLILLQFCSYIHQISIGHTKILNLTDTFNMTKAEENLCISSFFIGYLLFEIPSNIVLRLFGPTMYLSISMITWGGITVGMAFANNTVLFICIRFLLGVAEAGFFPGMIIYISLWYRRREQTMRIILFFLAVTIAGAIGGVLAYFINKMDGISGLATWRWILLLEGLPIIPLGFFTFFCFANIPETVRWLTPVEKQILTNILREDGRVADGEPETNNLLSWRQVRYVFTDWRIYLYTLISIGNLGVIRCWTVYFPSFLKMMTLSPENGHWLPAPAYIVATLCVFTVGFSSSRNNEHGYHLAVALATSAIGFLFMAVVGEMSKIAMYFCMTVACCGTFAGFPILLSWVTINVGGHTKRALAVGFVSGFGKVGGILAPWIYNVEDKCGLEKKCQFQQGHIICATIMSTAFLVTLLLRFLLNKENNRRANLGEAEWRRQAKVEEPCDKHPDVRYML